MKIGQLIRGAILCCGMAFVLLQEKLAAQDLHCSQFWMNAMRLNPAATGLIDGDLRAGTYSRTQWLSVTKPYQTNGAWAEAPVWKRKIQQDIFGAGLAVDMDQTGDSKYRTWQFNTFFSYSKSLNYRNNHFLSLGMMMGFVQKQLDISKLTTDEQYQGGLYHPELVSQENFPANSFSFPDMGVGLRWFYKPGKACAFDAGFSVMHLNRPQHSLLNDAEVFLPIKYATSFQMEIPINMDVVLRPSFYYGHQHVYNEVMAGLLAVYSFHFDQKGFVNKWIAGVDYRVGDAFYVVTGMEWHRFNIQLSYDFNTSRLFEASRGRGGFELSATYIYKKTNLFRPHKMPCPIF